MDGQFPRDCTAEPATGDSLCAIGLDVGATKTAAGVVAFPSGRVIHRQISPTLPGRGGQAVLANCLELASDMADRCRTHSLKLAGIGVGVPELVDLRGNVTSTHTLAWRGVKVAAHFQRIAPAIVESDVRAAALGEALFGSGLGRDPFLYLTVGSGISHCLVMDGIPYRGARGNALISASSPLSTVCPVCGTHLKPVLDEIAAGPALVAGYNATSGASLLRAEQVLAAASSGDTRAMTIVRTGGEALGTTLGFLVNVLDPELVVVGGGLGLAGGLYWDSFEASTRAHIWSDTNRHLPIVPAALGTDAGLVGAAAAAWRRLLTD